MAFVEFEKIFIYLNFYVIFPAVGSLYRRIQERM